MLNEKKLKKFEIKSLSLKIRLTKTENLKAIAAPKTSQDNCGVLSTAKQPVLDCIFPVESRLTKICHSIMQPMRETEAMRGARCSAGFTGSL
jgi:hypothetical protein